MPIIFLENNNDGQNIFKIVFGVIIALLAVFLIIKLLTFFLVVAYFAVVFVFPVIALILSAIAFCRKLKMRGQIKRARAVAREAHLALDRLNSRLADYERQLEAGE